MSVRAPGSPSTSVATSTPGTYELVQAGLASTAKARRAWARTSSGSSPAEIRVSIIVRFKVVDPTAAVHAVQDYESRIYSDVQLAARRSLASMALEEILTKLSIRR